MTESWFWNTEPRKIIAMLDERKKIESEKMKLQAYYTVCFLMGENPEEEENKIVLGIDTPIPEELLNKFF